MVAKFSGIFIRFYNVAAFQMLVIDNDEAAQPIKLPPPYVQQQIDQQPNIQLSFHFLLVCRGKWVGSRRSMLTHKLFLRTMEVFRG